MQLLLSLIPFIFFPKKFWIYFLHRRENHATSSSINSLYILSKEIFHIFSSSKRKCMFDAWHTHQHNLLCTLALLPCNKWKLLIALMMSIQNHVKKQYLSLFNPVNQYLVLNYTLWIVLDHIDSIGGIDPNIDCSKDHLCGRTHGSEIFLLGWARVLAVF